MKEKDCILVVDDDEGTRKSLTLLLKRKGFETEHAETGKEALAIAQARPVNLTLLDIKLPDNEGIQLLAPLKKTNPDMAIIMITGFASVESAVQSLTAGASGYITKPIDLDEMLARIKVALDNQHLVTEFRRAEEKIESLAKFPEENPNPVIRVANDGILIFANKSAEFILNELSGSVSTKVPEFLEKILKEALESSSRLELEIPVGKKTYLFTIVPIIGQNYINLYGFDITERKEAEEKLKHFNEELELAVKDRTDQLNKSLHEKEILLKEIHHRVKNNLQIIISLLRLQKIQVTDMATQQQILDSESRIRSMALVHEKLYRSTNLSSINFDDYIKTLVHQLISLYTINPGQVRIVIDLKEISVDINQAIQLGLIMNELISNAMKYAFPEGRKGELSVSGMQQGGSYVFTISDNGAGIPQDFNWRETKSLGLHIVILLTDQLNGTIELEKGAGTAFRLTIPEKT